MEKRWVFQKLVKKMDDGSVDVLGLVAYALYKAKKDEVATALREQGKPEAEIEQRLQEFHDNTLISDKEHENLRTMAENIIAKALQDSLGAMESALEAQVKAERERLNADHDSACKKLQKEHDIFEKKQKAIRNQMRKEEIDKLRVAVENSSVTSRFSRSAKWLWDGFAGLFATILTGILILGLMSYFGDANTKSAMLINVMKWLISTSTNNPLPEVILQIK